MFKINAKVIVKTIDELINEHILVSKDNYYVHEATRFILFNDFPYFGELTTIKSIDENDDNIPYFLGNGIWAPEWLIKDAEPKKVEVKVEVVDEKEPAEPKVWINKFNNKPFGDLFVKLINLDNKIATFSSTAFSRLKKHELQYIARLLMDHGCPAINLQSTVKDLGTYCYNNTKTLHV